MPDEVYSDWLPRFTPQEFDNQFPGGSFDGGQSRGGGIRAQIVNTAMSWLGVPYVWGGNSRNGVDCSGLVQQVFAHFGRQTPRVSYQQAGMGRHVPWNTLQPGDLVGWDMNDRNNGADHIAIYIGNGWIIEAPRPGLFVRKRRLGRYEDAFGVEIGW